MRKMFIVLLVFSWILVGFSLIYTMGYKNGSIDTSKRVNQWWIDQKKRYYDRDDILEKRHRKKHNLI